jgi:ABC-type phosphate transport system ATPase subunit
MLLLPWTKFKVSIKKLKTRKTLIIVTHNMEEIDYGSNVIYLEPPNHYSADVN